MAKAKAESGTPKKSTAVAKAGNLDELNALRMETVALEAENKEAGGRQNSYLRIIGNSASTDREFTNPKSPNYIKGAGDATWIVPSKRLLLGKEVEITVKGMFKVYEDSVPGDKKEDQRKTVGFWLPADAEQIPLEGIFDRPFTDKQGVQHLLRPVHWVFVYLHEFPEIDDGLLTFRSVGNGVYRQLQKLIASQAESCTELRLTMTNQVIKSGKHPEYLYPYFEISGRNYDVEDGKISLCKGGMDIDTLKAVLKGSHELNKDYTELKMVSKKGNLAGLVSGAAPTAIEDKRGGKVAKKYAEDEDDAPAKF